MPLGREIGLGPGHIVLDGNQAPHKGGGAAAPHFSAHVYCDQTAGWIKMPLGRKVGLGPGHIVLDGDPASPTQRGGGHSPQFVAHVLWPNSRPYQLLQNTWFIFVMYCLYDFTVLIRVI